MRVRMCMRTADCLHMGPRPLSAAVVAFGEPGSLARLAVSLNANPGGREFEPQPGHKTFMEIE